MFDRFTETARRVIREAHEEAQRRQHRSVNAEHLSDCGYKFDLQQTSKSDQVLKGRLGLAVKIAVGVSFFQAGVTAAFVIVLIFERNVLPGAYGFNLYSLIDAIALTGFALALLKGHLWAAYGLFAYGLLDWVGKVARSGQVAWIVPVMVYAIGAMTLSRSQHLTPKASHPLLVSAASYGRLRSA
jgi:hypothetical protein